MHNKKKLRKVKKAASEDRPQAGVKLITLKSGFHHLANTWLRKQETGVTTNSPNNGISYLAGFTRGPQQLT